MSHENPFDWNLFVSNGRFLRMVDYGEKPSTNKTVHEYSNGYAAIREFVVYSWMVFGRAGQRVAEGISRIVVG